MDLDNSSINDLAIQDPQSMVRKLITSMEHEAG